MSRPFKKRIYLFTTFFVVGWWAYAFYPSHSNSRPVISMRPLQEEALPSVLQMLSPIDRQEIKAALLGDFRLMSRLIADWEIDADLIEAEGIKGVKRLLKTDFLEAATLGRLFSYGGEKLLKALNDECRFHSIIDDRRISIDLSTPPERFLPQTYVAATFLLALTKPEQIVAIPRGMREQSALFPPEITANVPLDVDRYSTETLYSEQPQLAFVANYSHPSTLEALKNQGVQLFTLQNFESLPELFSALLRVGQAINRSMEAHMLKHFIDAAIKNIDNRLLLLSLNHEPLRVAYLQYYAQLSVPSQRTLIRFLLNRLEEYRYVFLRPESGSNDCWAAPVQQEQICQFNPHCIIISSPSGQPIETIFHPPTSTYFVDESIQNSPTQYVVLAYFDLFKALQTALHPSAS